MKKCMESKKEKEKGRKNAAENIKEKDFFLLSFFLLAFFLAPQPLSLSLSPLKKTFGVSQSNPSVW
jgi:hypothetical protein